MWGPEVWIDEIHRHCPDNRFPSAHTRNPSFHLPNDGGLGCTTIAHHRLPECLKCSSFALSATPALPSSSTHRRGGRCQLSCCAELPISKTQKDSEGGSDDKSVQTDERCSLLTTEDSTMIRETSLKRDSLASSAPKSQLHDRDHRHCRHCDPNT